MFVQCGDGWIAEEAWRRVLKGFACGLDTSPRQVARASELRGVPGKLENKTSATRIGTTGTYGGLFTHTFTAPAGGLKGAHVNEKFAAAAWFGASPKAR